MKVKIFLAFVFLQIFSSASDAQTTQFTLNTKVRQLTFFGLGGPTSAETLVTSAVVPDELCGAKNVDGFWFVGRIGAPTQPPTNITNGDFVRLTNVLLDAYLNQRPIQISYECPPNQTPLIVQVQ